MRRYRADLVGLGQFMQDRAPEVDDHTLMALGELIELIGTKCEEQDEDGESDELIRSAYRCAAAWMLNQGRA